MDLGPLIDGFATAADPDEPAVRLDRRAPRHRGRRAARHRPGHDGRAAAAGHLLPGADQRADHVRRHLLRRHVRRLDDLDPAQHPGRVAPRWSPPSRATRWPSRAAPPRRWPPRRSARSSPARSARRCWWPARPIVADFAVSIGAPDYFAIMLLALHRGHRGARLLAAARLLLAGPRPRHRPGRHRQDLRPAAADLRACRSSPTASTSSSSRSAIFALGEALWVAAHLRRKAAQVIPVGQPWMGREDWQRSWKPWLRGTAFGFPFGALPGRRRGDPDVPVLRHREAALQAPRGVRQGRHRGRRRARRRPTTPPPPGRSCRC